MSICDAQATSIGAGDLDVLCTKFSEAEMLLEELPKATDAGTEKLEPQEHSFAPRGLGLFRGCCLL